MSGVEEIHLDRLPYGLIACFWWYQSRSDERPNVI
jgi:hypothetical protein